MEAKNGNVSLTVGVTKKVADIAVVLSLQYESVSAHCIRRLMYNTPGEIDKGSHDAALAYAIFEVVRDKLSSPLELSKSRVTNIYCSALNGKFNIFWNCQGTGSILRKTAGICIDALKPEKMYSKYAENVKFLTGKNGTRDTFDECVKHMVAGLSKGITIVAVGKININDDKLKDIVATVGKKYKFVGGAEEKMSAPASATEYPFVECNGITAAAVADYIRANSGGMGIDVVPGGIVIYNNSWISKKKSLSETKRIKDYLKKYEKLGDGFGPIFAYFMAIQHWADADTCIKAIKSPPTIASLANSIEAALKK